MNLMVWVVVLAVVILMVAVCILVVLVRQRRRTPGSAHASLDIPTPLETVTRPDIPSVKEAKQAERIVLGPEGSPFLTIQASQRAIGLRTEPCQLPAPTRANLSQLLAGAPTAALAGLSAASQSGSYLLSLAPAVQAGLADGSLKLMDAAGGGWRAMATDGSRIAGQGTLTSVGPSAVSVGAAVWAVAAYVTAQKYLADIDRRLRAIESAVDRLQMWSEHEIRAHIDADMRYLRDLFGIVRDGELREGSFHGAVTQLETIDREISRRVVELQRRLEDLVSSVEGARIEIGWMTGSTLESHRERLGKQAEVACRWLADLVGALHVKGAAAQLRSGLPGDVGFARRRVADLRADIQGTSQLHQRFHSALDRRANELVGKWTSADKDGKAQEHVRAIASRASEYATKHIQGVTEAAKQIDVITADRLAAAAQPLQLVVTITGTEVTSCQRVVAPKPT